jgi:integrase
MSGMRDYTDEELTLVRQSFAGRYALRDRCYFECALQMGLRVSEMLSITVGQVYQYGKVIDEVSIDRKHMKGGRSGKASGRTIPVFAATKPYILAWLQRMATMLKVKDVKNLDPALPLFLSRVRNPDGSRRAIARETAWRLIKLVARTHELSGIGTHSTRKTLAQRSYDYAKAAGIEDPMRFTQKILGHKSIASTEHYVRSLTSRQAWEQYRAGVTSQAA